MLSMQELELRLRSKCLSAEFTSHAVRFAVPRIIESQQLLVLYRLEAYLFNLFSEVKNQRDRL